MGTAHIYKLLYSLQALIRLNKLGIKMSPKSINRILDRLGEDFDKPLQEWKDSITRHFEKYNKTGHEIQKLENTKKELVQSAAAIEDISQQITAMDEHLSNLSAEKRELEELRPTSFSIVLDNVDLRVLASNMTSDDQNKDFHWCNHNAYRDRVNPTHLNDNDPIADLQNVPNSTFLPSLTDQNSLQNDFTVLIGRVLVENVPAFSIFKDVIPLHIKHAYSENMKQKTETVR